MRASRSFGSILVLVLVLATSSTPGEARAGLILGNLGGTSYAGQALGGTGPSALSFATRFTMGATPDTMTDAMLLLNLPASFAGSPVLALYADGGTTPGPALATFSTPGSLASGNTVVDFALSYNLQANTSYWLVLSGVATFSWLTSVTYEGMPPKPYADDPSGPGATFSGLAGGVGSPAVFTAQSPISPFGNNVVAYQLNGASVVPEPPSLILAGIGGGLALAVRRRKQRPSATAASSFERISEG